CGRTTIGRPLFCNYCGRSYDRRICSQKHANPRTAEACSRCGTRNLSVPQPKVPLLWRLIAAALELLAALVVIAVSLAFFRELHESLAASSDVPGRLAAQWLGLILLFAGWYLLPDWLRLLIYVLLKRKRQRD